MLQINSAALLQRAASLLQLPPPVVNSVEQSARSVAQETLLRVAALVRTYARVYKAAAEVPAQNGDAGTVQDAGDDRDDREADEQLPMPLDQQAAQINTSAASDKAASLEAAVVPELGRFLWLLREPGAQVEALNVLCCYSLLQSEDC